ncbi:MAG: DUF92 domain-containing protein [Thermoplasmata archaeon]
MPVRSASVPMLSLLLSVIGVLATLGLAGLAVVGKALTRAAGAVAAAFGIVIVIEAGFPYLALLVLFVGASSIATHYHFEEKRGRNVQEGTAGERGVSNVVSHIVIPTGLALAGGVGFGSPALIALLFASALAFGAADTFASEFGVLAGKARSILTFRPVLPGTNGGVSGPGQVFAVAGAVGTAVVALVLFVLFRSPVGSVPLFLFIVGAAGFLGCQVDSVLGETLENRGYLTKGSTNLLGMLSSVTIAMLFVLAFRGTL